MLGKVLRDAGLPGAPRVSPFGPVVQVAASQPAHQVRAPQPSEEATGAARWMIHAGSFRRGGGAFRPVGPAADRGFGRQQHEPVDAKRRRPERLARRQVFGDLSAGRIAQAGQREMGGIFAALGIEPDPLHQPFKLGLQLVELARRRNAGNDRARAAAAERGEPLELHLEGPPRDTGQHGHYLAGEAGVDVADEAQGQVIVGRIGPARAGQAAPQGRQRQSDISGNFERRVNPGQEHAAVTRVAPVTPRGSRRRHERIRSFPASRQGPRRPFARAISSSTFGRMPATMTSTPAAEGWMPSGWVGWGAGATPSRKNGEKGAWEGSGAGRVTAGSMPRSASLAPSSRITASVPSGTDQSRRWAPPEAVSPARPALVTEAAMPLAASARASF